MSVPKLYLTRLVLGVLLLLVPALSTPGQGIEINNYGWHSCLATFDHTNFLKVNKCIPVKKNYGYISPAAFDPWPVCADGKDAQFARFGPSNHNCDTSKWKHSESMGRLESKDMTTSACVKLSKLGSFAFWCDGPEVLDESEIAETTSSVREGGVLHYPEKGCRTGKPKASHYLPDTCIDIEEGYGLQFTAPAICKNGTKALVAGFSGKDCDPTSNPLKEPFTEWDDRVIGFCLPTEGIRSMTFWCDGFDDIDMTKPKEAKKPSSSSNLGLILGLSLGIGGLFIIVIGVIATYALNFHFREKIKAIFSSGDGYIAL